MKIQEITCKTALSQSKLPGLTYTLNPYVGCMHQCKYCYAPSILRMKRDEWETVVKIKRNIPSVLAKEMKHKKPGTIAISTVTDPYQPVEKTYQLTKFCLEVLKNYDFPISIQTKSDLILRDKDLIQQFSDIEVMMSIGTLNDEHRKLLEPGSSSIKDRLEVLKQFSKSNVKTSVFFGPIYPTVTLEEIPQILDIFLELEISELMIDSLHIKPGIIKPMQEAVTGNERLKQLFSYEYLKLQPNYQKIRNTIKAYLKDTSITVEDAFA